MHPLQHYDVMLSCCPHDRHFPMWFNECSTGVHGDVLARRARIVGEYATRILLQSLAVLAAEERKAA